MKIGHSHRVILAALILGAFTLVSGCTTTGMQRSAKTKKTMQAVEEDIQKAVAQVDVTSASLQEVINPSQSNPKKAFGKYSDNVEKMDKLGERLIEHTDKMSSQGKEYFEEWKEQGDAYTNPEIQALSEQRRADLNATFAKIAAASVGVKGAFKAYMSDNREIQTYLSNDLTPKGIESITPVAEKAISNGEDLKYAVTPVLTAIGEAKAEFAQSGKK